MNRPEFWIIAGINGAGKSTASTSGEYGDCLNPDAIAKKVGRFVFWPLLANWAAVEFVERNVARSIEAGTSVSVETVLSTDKYLPHVRRAKKRGFHVGMVYVTLASVDLSIERVRSRVLAGGHDVPTERIRDRWARSLDQLVAFAPLVDDLRVLDNSDLAPVLVAYKASTGAIVNLHPTRLPDITARFP